MKIKTTKKAIKNSGQKILKVGYCDLQYLLQGKNPFAYSTRVEGWACDYYEINDIIISTGYAPIGDQVDYNIIKKYEALAREKGEKINGWDNLKVELDKLIIEFLGEVL